MTAVEQYLAIRATNSADLERHVDDVQHHNGLIPGCLFTYYAIGAFNRRSERRRSERLAEMRGGGA